MPDLDVAVSGAQRICRNSVFMGQFLKCSPWASPPNLNTATCGLCPPYPQTTPPQPVSAMSQGFLRDLHQPPHLQHHGSVSWCSSSPAGNRFRLASDLPPVSPLNWDGVLRPCAWQLASRTSCHEHWYLLPPDDPDTDCFISLRFLFDEMAESPQIHEHQRLRDKTLGALSLLQHRMVGV